MKNAPQLTPLVRIIGPKHPSIFEWLIPKRKLELNYLPSFINSVLNIAGNPNEGVFQHVVKREIQRAANAPNQSQRIRQFFTQQKPKNEKGKKQ